MNKTQILKGLGMMAAIIYAAFQAGTNVWPVAVVVAVATGVGYFISNLWVVSSSQEGTLNWQDAVKGFLLAVFAFVAASAVTFFDGQVLAWKPLIFAALSAGAGYLFPTLFTGQKGSTPPVQSDPVIPPKG